MATTTDAARGGWTAADLVARFGPIPLCRVGFEPPPGAAVEADVLALNQRDGRLCELVDGVLVEKAMGAYESYLAMLIGQYLGTFARRARLGIVLGADGMARLAPGLVRIPDASLITWQRLGTRRVPRTAMLDLAPDLAVEVISKSNTAKEMADKLVDYFAAGVRAVWYIYPAEREFHVFSSPDEVRVLGEAETLEDSELLPGFRLSLSEYFAEEEE